MANTWQNAQLNIPSGFNDGLQQILVIPQDNIPPNVCVEHELTHVNLVINSSFGLVEHLFSWASITAHAAGDEDGANRAETLLRHVRRHAVLTHEFVAWFGTELLTAGHENLVAPAAYTKGVRRLHRLFSEMPGTPLSTDEYFVSAMSIAEEIGIASLNVPCVGNLWSQPSRSGIDTFITALDTMQNDPTSRFFRLCDYMTVIPFPDASNWSNSSADTRLSIHDLVKSCQHNRSLFRTFSDWFKRRMQFELCLLQRSSLPSTGTVNLATVIMESLSSPKVGRWMNVADVDMSLKRYDAIASWNLNVDRYSQTCVLTPAAQMLAMKDAPAVSTATDLQRFFDDSSFLLVFPGLRSGPWDLNVRMSQIINLIAPMAIGTTRSWQTTLSTAPEVLNYYANEQRKPIVISGSTYKFGVGDIVEESHVLRDLPHAVFCISDFKTLWFRLAWSDMGLAGNMELEYDFAPISEHNNSYGYIVIKPHDGEFPVIISPIIFAQRDRVVSVIHKLPSPYGLRLEEQKHYNPKTWLSSRMYNAVAAATTYFSTGSKRPAGMPLSEIIDQAVKRRTGASV